MTHRGGASFRDFSYDSKLSRVVRIPHDRGTYRKFDLRQRGPKVSATYVSIAKTCPSSCAFKGSGCFAETGFTRVLGKKLDWAAQWENPSDVARFEAQLIDEAFPRGVPQDGARGGRDLRLHVGGETPNVTGARALARAAKRWVERGGGQVWTYTHRWRSIAREAFGSISALASVESWEGAVEARERGYVPALVVDRFPDGKNVFSVHGYRFVPCPAEVQPGKVTCSSCRLCMNDGMLRDRGLGIAFAVHGGTQKSKALEAVARA